MPNEPSGVLGPISRRRWRREVLFTMRRYVRLGYWKIFAFRRTSLDIVEFVLKDNILPRYVQFCVSRSEWSMFSGPGHELLRLKVQHATTTAQEVHHAQ